MRQRKRRRKEGRDPLHALHLTPDHALGRSHHRPAPPHRSVGTSAQGAYMHARVCPSACPGNSHLLCLRRSLRAHPARCTEKEREEREESEERGRRERRERRKRRERDRLLKMSEPRTDAPAIRRTRSMLLMNSFSTPASVQGGRRGR
jgi:hypothetical protein